MGAPIDTRKITWRVETEGLPDDACMTCEHTAREHGPHGCESGWEWDDEGKATTLGCSCFTQVHR